jgi:hypothetical protein
MSARLRHAALPLLAASAIACGDSSGPPQPAQVRVTDGDGQVAPAGTLLPAPIGVTVVDGDGSPTAGAHVVWRTDGGRLLPLSATTDASGRALARWELGTDPGRRSAEALVAGLAPAVFTAVAEPPDALPFDQIRPLDFATYDGSHQVVHPDFVATPAGAFAASLHLAITPYPFGDPAFENPSFFEGGRRDIWTLPAGAPNPVVLPDAGYLSDPDIVWVPERGELWLYYRQVTADNIVRLVRTRDGRTWSPPIEVARAPNHEIVSPSVVRRAEGDWWMFAVNSGPAGCGAASTTVEARRSSDGVRWGPPATVSLEVPGFWAWHLDVQWIAEEGAFWALFNGKTEGGCTTPALFIARSENGTEWTTVRQPVLVKGTIAVLQDIVYRSTFEYDPVADAVTFWFSGARYENGKYHWGAAVERRRRAAVFDALAVGSNTAFLPPAPAPLDDWP